MLFNIVFIALYGLVLNQTIDNFGHLGGLLTGAIYGFIQIPKDLYKDPRDAGNAAQFGGLAALGIFIAVCVVPVPISVIGSFIIPIRACTLYRYYPVKIFKVRWRCGCPFQGISIPWIGRCRFAATYSFY